MAAGRVLFLFLFSFSLLFFVGVFIGAECEVVKKRHQEVLLGDQNRLKSVGDVVETITDAFAFKRASMKDDLVLLRRSLEWLLDFSTYVNKYAPTLEVSEDDFVFFDYFFPELYATVDATTKESEEKLEEVRITLIDEPNVLFVSKKAEDGDDCEEEKIKEMESEEKKKNAKIDRQNEMHANAIFKRNFVEKDEDVKEPSAVITKMVANKRTTPDKMAEDNSTAAINKVAGNKQTKTTTETIENKNTPDDFESSVAIARFMKKLKSAKQ